MALPAWLRDLLLLAAAFAVVLGGLYAYAGTWPPAVIVESGSMMHLDAGYGRLGTIDPGDLVLVKRVASADEVGTLVEGSHATYGKGGDVVVYFSAGDHAQTPIIHRAIAYVEPTGSGYRVRWAPDAPCVGGATRDGSWCVYGPQGVTLPDIGMTDYRPDQAGFITKGDNPVTNPQADVVAGISHDASGRPSIVHADWIEGKARGEVPWLGLVKLALAGKPNERAPPASWTKIGSAYAPSDLWVCLGIALLVIVGGPVAYDLAKAARAKRAAAGGPPGAPLDVAGRAADAGSVELTWRPPPTGPPAARYRVYRGQARVGETTEPRFTEAGLVPGVTYVYAVSALDAAGAEGPRSPHASVTASDAARSA